MDALLWVKLSPKAQWWSAVFQLFKFPRICIFCDKASQHYCSCRQGGESMPPIVYDSSRAAEVARANVSIPATNPILFGRHSSNCSALEEPALMLVCIASVNKSPSIAASSTPPLRPITFAAVSKINVIGSVDITRSKIGYILYPEIIGNFSTQWRPDATSSTCTKPGLLSASKGIWTSFFILLTASRIGLKKELHMVYSLPYTNAKRTTMVSRTSLAASTSRSICGPQATKPGGCLLECSVPTGLRS